MSRDTLPDAILIRGARENNLRGLDLDIPKRKITVFTGISGSGKSSLVFDTIAAESQRLINETYNAFIQSFMPRYAQPDADSISNLSAAIVVDQQRLGGNSRSIVGTVTDTYSLLRSLYSRLGSPRLENPKAFSFNDPVGMCVECGGAGRIAEVDVDSLVDRGKSLNEGAILFPTFAVDSWFWKIIAQSGFFDLDKKLSDYSEEEWRRLAYLPEAKFEMGAGAGNLNTTYEGLVPKFKRLYLGKDPESMAAHLRAAVEGIVARKECPACGGSRINRQAMASAISGKNIADCMAMQVDALAEFIGSIDAPGLTAVLGALAAKLEQLDRIGLGYLSLGRECSTLSGGESQRIKMVRHLGSSLTDIAYILDEPSVGLHPHDVHRLTELLLRLRDNGNTVLLVEHNAQVMAIADHVVDMGPDAGREGGRIVYQGDYAGLLLSKGHTGSCLRRAKRIKEISRSPTGILTIKDASLNNLKGLCVDIPEGVLTVVTGVSGAGKTSLIQGCFCAQQPRAVIVDQSLGRGSRRSNAATYTGALDLIRKAFAKANGVDASLFSANSKGACPDCQGLGVVYTDLAYLDPLVSVCEGCGGKRFNGEVLRYALRGKSISDVFLMSVSEAMDFFIEPGIASKIRALADVGLGYLNLGQDLATLSGGERQRLKLANELGKPGQVYVLDEPTNGLHMKDVENFIRVLDRFVDEGSTVVVVEHNMEMICSADWVIDLGPGAGSGGGRLVFAGTPRELTEARESLTGLHLSRYLREDAAD